MKKGASLVLLLLFVCLPCLPQEKKSSLSLFGGLQTVLSYGSEDDYSPGENDFPVTPAHSPLTVGLSLGHRFSGLLGFELDGRYIAASSIMLSDPSDGDTVEVDTLNHVLATANLLFFFGRGAFCPYLAVGAGADIVLGAGERTRITDLGYEVTFLAPEKKTNPAAALGLGFLYSLDPTFGLRADVRYALSPRNADHGLIHNVSVVAGLTLKVF